MFSIKDTTISLSRGDTGSVIIGVTGYEFGEDDRAVWTVKNGAGEIILERYYEIDEDGEFEVTFVNSTTDTLALGNYSWDVRYVINPRYSQGKIVDGDQVMTPNPPMTLILLGTVGDV